MDLQSSIASMAAAYGVDPNYALAIAKTESNFNPAALGPQTRYGRAVGTMQVLPSTCAQYGLDANDPSQNIECGVRDLADMLKRYGGDPSLAAAAYNAGPGNVDKYGGVPPFRETVNYVEKVLGLLPASTSDVSSGDVSSSDLPDAAPDLTLVYVGGGLLLGGLLLAALR